MANQFCVVCGRGSARVLWNNAMTVGATTYVACDFHSLSEFSGAVQVLVNPPGPDVVNQDQSIDESPAA